MRRPRMKYDDASTHPMKGDGEAMSPGDRPTTLYQRFTVAQHMAGKTTGWHFVAGWFVMSDVRWAWFEREDGGDG